MLKRNKQTAEGKRGRALFIIFLLIIACSKNFSQVVLTDAFPNLTFASPVDLQHPGDGTNRLFVVEQPGIIKVFENSPSITAHKDFLDIRDRVQMGGEMGLLGLAFHPDYINNGYFYVNYTTMSPDRQTIISRFTVSSDPDIADPGSELILIRQPQPYSNHNGGQLAFGPDGYLYIALGDGGSGGDPLNNAQNRSTLLGKILRIDVNSVEGNLNYAIPPDNPYKDNSNGFREEIFAYGLRNPWRFSFDAFNGSIWCGDVGQGDWEEIDIIESGKNYGWRYKEGDHCYNPPANCDTIEGLISPIWEYNHTSGGVAVTGGYVYRGSRIPELYGKYIYGDYLSKNIWKLTNDSAAAPLNEYLLTAPGLITSFGTDKENELYVCLVAGSGKIYKFSSLTGTAAGETGNISGYYLSPAFPNPFNPATAFSLHLPDQSEVKIDVINAAGEVIALIKNEVMQGGNHLITWRADEVPSGIYFIRINALSLINTKTYRKINKVVFIK